MARDQKRNVQKNAHIIAKELQNRVADTGLQ